MYFFLIVNWNFFQKFLQCYAVKTMIYQYAESTLTFSITRKISLRALLCLGYYKKLNLVSVKSAVVHLLLATHVRRPTLKAVYLSQSLRICLCVVIIYGILSYIMTHASFSSLLECNKSTLYLMMLHLRLESTVQWWVKYAYKSDVKRLSHRKEQYKCWIKMPDHRSLSPGLVPVQTDEENSSEFRLLNCYIEQRNSLCSSPPSLWRIVTVSGEVIEYAEGHLPSSVLWRYWLSQSWPG